MGDELSVEPNKVQDVGAFLRDIADHAAVAGLCLGEAWLSHPDNDATICSGANRVSSVFAGFLDDITLSATGLGSAVGTAGRIYLSVDDAAAYRLDGLW